jgi:protein SCO1/2
MKILPAVAMLVLAMANPSPTRGEPQADVATALPGESVYQLSMDLTDQDGRALALADLRGSPVLVTMFYGSCSNVCPMIAYHLRRIERALPEAQRSRLRVLMVSFDPKRDTPAALHEFARAHQADPVRWTVARAEEAQVQDLAAVLGIRYRELDGGVFNHSSVITLLDRDGMIRARTSDLKTLDPAFMQEVAVVVQ